MQLEHMYHSLGIPVQMVQKYFSQFGHTKFFSPNLDQHW